MRLFEDLLSLLFASLDTMGRISLGENDEV
jgi:hypothetical protein